MRVAPQKYVCAVPSRWSIPAGGRWWAGPALFPLVIWYVTSRSERCAWTSLGSGMRRVVASEAADDEAAPAAAATPPAQNA